MSHLLETATRLANSGLAQVMYIRNRVVSSRSEVVGVPNREVARAYCGRFARATGDAERHAQGYSMSRLFRELAH